MVSYIIRACIKGDRMQSYKVHHALSTLQRHESMTYVFHLLYEVSGDKKKSQSTFWPYRKDIHLIATFNPVFQNFLNDKMIIPERYVKEKNQTQFSYPLHRLASLNNNTNIWTLQNYKILNFHKDCQAVPEVSAECLKQKF